MKYENDVVVILVGRFLFVYYLNVIFVEEGCYVFFVDIVDIFCVVLFDGSIWVFINNKVIVVVEIKCFFLLEK